MPTINQQIEARVQQFVTEVSGLVRESALTAVRDALSGGSAPARRSPGRLKGAGRGPGRPPNSAMSVRRGSSGRRARRSSADVEATAQKMLAYVKANDGKRLDEIAKALGTDTATLTRPSQMLLESKAVKRSGQRRGTKYHIGSGAMAKAVTAPTPATTRRAKKA